MSEALESGNGEVRAKEGAAADRLETDANDTTQSVHDGEIGSFHPSVGDHTKREVQGDERDPTTESKEPLNLSVADEKLLGDRQFGQQLKDLFEGMEANVGYMESRIEELEYMLDDLKEVTESLKHRTDIEKKEVMQESSSLNRPEIAPRTPENDTTQGSDNGSAAHIVDTSTRRIAKPELNWLSWRAYKDLLRVRHNSHYSPAIGYHAVDVLHGERQWWYQRLEQGNHAVQETEHTERSAKGQALTVALPDRIRINSVPVIRILKSLESTSMGDHPWTMRKPFKMLFYHQSRLKDILDELSVPFTEADSGASSTVNERDDLTEAIAGSPEKAVQLEQKGKESLDKTKPDYKTTDPPSDDSLEAFCDLKCLIHFMTDIVEPAIAEIRETQMARFEDLCFLFSPGGYIFYKMGPQKVWRIYQAYGGRSYLASPKAWYDRAHLQDDDLWSPLCLDCYYLDFDGSYYIPVYKQFMIQHFRGLRSLDTLMVKPYDLLSREVREEEQLQNIGKDFLQALHVSRKRYVGPTLVTTPSGEKLDETAVAENIDSLVILDYEQALNQNPTWKPRAPTQTQTLSPNSWETVETTYYKQSEYNRLHPGLADQDQSAPTNSIMKRSKSGIQGCASVFCCDNEWIPDDSIWDQKRAEDLVADDPVLRRSRVMGIDQIPEDQYKLLSRRVFGFVLRTRKWASFSLDYGYMKDLVLDKEGINDLQLPGQHKTIVQALVNSHFQSRSQGQETSNTDLVRGKGKGLILLLHGAPGVGKTSTAECVAEAMGKPLFPITCGDLGLTADAVESSLFENFRLATRWNCILLLDEADVFLARRTKTELARNALVSVFLRELEYYSGILFLTTNRVGQIDDAFKSRIHMSLYYPPLSREQTENIWKINIKRFRDLKPGLRIDDGALLSYSRWLYDAQMRRQSFSWNGRQIRNAFQTAVALAEASALLQGSEVIELQISYFQDVAKASDEFDDYLRKTRGMTEADLASHDLLRNDKWQAEPLANNLLYPLPGTGDIGTQYASQWPGQRTSSSPQFQPAVPLDRRFINGQPFMGGSYGISTMHNQPSLAGFNGMPTASAQSFPGGVNGMPSAMTQGPTGGGGMGDNYNANRGMGGLLEPQQQQQQPSISYAQQTGLFHAPGSFPDYQMDQMDVTASAQQPPPGT